MFNMPLLFNTLVQNIFRFFFTIIVHIAKSIFYLQHFQYLFCLQIQSKMPRNACCNPYGIHRVQQTKSLRQVTDAIASISSLVNKGDFVCVPCRMKLTTPPKVVPSTSESALEPPDPERPNPNPQNPGPSNPGPSNPGPSNPEPSNPEPSDPEPSDPEPSDPELPNLDPQTHSMPSTSGTQNEDEILEVSTDESFLGDSADESAEESTAEEYSTEVEEEIAQPILNEFLPTLGQSPVKRSK